MKKIKIMNRYLPDLDKEERRLGNKSARWPWSRGQKWKGVSQFWTSTFMTPPRKSSIEIRKTSGAVKCRFHFRHATFTANWCRSWLSADRTFPASVRTFPLECPNPHSLPYRPLKSRAISRRRWRKPVESETAGICEKRRDYDEWTWHLGALGDQGGGLLSAKLTISSEIRDLGMWKWTSSLSIPCQLIKNANFFN